MKNCRSCYLICIFLACFSFQALAINVPYLCDFEDDAENANWVINENSANAQDKWVIGSATHNEGSRSMYISTDAGVSAKFGSSPNTVFAYRKFYFPQSAVLQKYEIGFNWKSLGQENSGELYVYFGLPSAINFSASSTVGIASSALKNAAQRFNGSATLCNNDMWQNATFNVNVSANNSTREFILLFVWVNGNLDSEAVDLGACIDNVQISSANVAKPTDFTASAECIDVTLSWIGTLNSYNVEYRSVNSSKWRVISGISASGTGAESYTISGLAEGSWNFRVRGVLGNDTSSYATLNNVVVYCPESHCINFVDLYASNVTCRYGTTSAPDANIGVIDRGEEAEESRHVVNWTQGMYDVRTDNQLRTIPDGQMASVRLGNWASSGEQESISYDFVVDSANQAILILEYAIVLENPENHTMQEQPFFGLEILNASGELIDPTCGVAQFYAGYGAGNWYEVNPESYNKVLWKDWTTIGLNLSAYDGQTLTVKISTMDCTLGGHYGYAYFTLDCVSAKLTTSSCGDNPVIEAVAPDGFLYTWTNPNYPDSVWTTQSLDVSASDTTTYTCEVCYKDQDGCCFSLSTAVFPRFPVAEFSYSYEPHDCQNYIKLNNTSHIMNMYGGVENHTDETCENYEWYINDGRTFVDTNPTISCDNAGDTLNITLMAFIAEEACYDDTVITVIVPNILNENDTIYKEICDGSAVEFNGTYYSTTGIYSQVNTNVAGCDSITVLNLVVHPRSEDTNIAATVCSADGYTLNDKKYTETGIYEQWLFNQYGCDSIVVLDLTVVPELDVDVDEIATLCADDGTLAISYDIYNGAFDSLAIRFNADAQAAGFTNRYIYDNTIQQIVYQFGENTPPNKYEIELEFYQAACGNQLFIVPFDVRYASSITQQKWNDVIAILNSKYNGGYEFTSYQWYKDGQPIDGATGPYLYKSLEMGSEYNVLLTRADGVAAFSCPIVAEQHTDLSVYPTVLQAGKSVHVNIDSESGKATWVNVMGLTVERQQLQKSTDIVSPSIKGAYLLIVEKADGEKISYRILLE